MTNRTLCVALVLSILPVAGCGTAANLVRQRPGQGGVSPFGGVKHDVWCVKQAADGQFGIRGQPKSDSENYPQRAVMLVCAADIPLSFIADIVTWPYTKSYTYINQPPPVPPVVITQPMTQGMSAVPVAQHMSATPVPMPQAMPATAMPTASATTQELPPLPDVQSTPIVPVINAAPATQAMPVAPAMQPIAIPIAGKQ